MNLSWWVSVYFATKLVFHCKYTYTNLNVGTHQYHFSDHYQIDSDPDHKMC